MTRIGGYELLACPHCKQIHRKAHYSSINLQVNPDFFERMKESRYCSNCGTSLEISEMISLGFRDLKSTTLDFSKSQLSIWGKIKGIFNATKNQGKTIKNKPEWMNYPVI